MIAGGIMQMSDALGVNAPLTANALSDNDKAMIKRWGSGLKEGKSKNFGYGDGKGMSAMANPDEYKPFDSEADNLSRRKLAGIYGSGSIQKVGDNIVVKGGDYDFNQSATRTISTPMERFESAKTAGSDTGSLIKGVAQSVMRNIAPAINTVAYDERPQIEQLDDNGRPVKDATGKFVMMPNPDLEKNIALNKTRKRGATMESVVS